MMIRTRWMPLVVAALSLAATAASAGSLKFKPGKWEMSTTVKSPMLPQAHTTTEKECITPEEARDPLKEMVTDENCEISDRSESGDALTWKMKCRGDGGQTMAGTGEIRTDGDAASGKMEVTMEMEGRSISMETNWKGKRLGDCD